MTSAPASIHGTAILLGETGVLILGASGAGKSCLAAELVASTEAAGRYAALVADDRVVLDVAGGRLIARPHPALAGRLELRGAGLVRRAHAPAAVLHVCIALDEAAPRLPDEETAPFEAGGVPIPRFVVNRALAPSVTRWRLELLEGGAMMAG